MFFPIARAIRPSIRPNPCRFYCYETVPLAKLKSSEHNRVLLCGMIQRIKRGERGTDEILLKTVEQDGNFNTHTIITKPLGHVVENQKALFKGWLYANLVATNEHKTRKRPIVRAYFGTNMADNCVDVNSVELMGHVTSNIYNSNHATNFSMAVHFRSIDAKTVAIFHDVRVFDEQERAAIAESELKKSDHLLVRGSIVYQRVSDADGKRVHVGSVTAHSLTKILKFEQNTAAAV